MKRPLTTLFVLALVLPIAGASLAHENHVHERTPQRAAVVPAAPARPATLSFDFGGPFSLDLF